MGTIKVQINSVEALERFIGKNPDFEIQIQEQIARNLINRHLGNNLKNLGDELIEKLICDTEKGSNYYKTKLKLKPEIESKAMEIVKLKMTSLLEEICEKVFNVNELKGKSMELLSKQSEWIEKELTQLVLTDRIEKLVDQRLKARMGIK